MFLIPGGAESLAEVLGQGYGAAAMAVEADHDCFGRGEGNAFAVMDSIIEIEAGATERG